MLLLVVADAVPVVVLTPLLLVSPGAPVVVTTTPLVVVAPTVVVDGANVGGAGVVAGGAVGHTPTNVRHGVDGPHQLSLAAHAA